MLVAGGEIQYSHNEQAINTCESLFILIHLPDSECKITCNCANCKIIAPNFRLTTREYGTIIGKNFVVARNHYLQQNGIELYLDCFLRRIAFVIRLANCLQYRCSNAVMNAIRHVENGFRDQSRTDGVLRMARCDEVGEHSGFINALRVLSPVFSRLFPVSKGDPAAWPYLYEQLPPICWGSTTTNSIGF